MNESYVHDHKPDVEVWRDLKNGKRSALKILFNRYYSDLYLYAYKLCGNVTIAEDCVQELFYRIWDRREFLGDVSSVKSYLWISLRRDVFKTLNREIEKIRSEDISLYTEMLTFTYEDFIIHKEKSREQRQLLVKALNKLPERHKEAIILKYFNGMGYKEIQQIMSVNYQTARNYVYHGVKALKEYFEDRNFVPPLKAFS